jgi:hypothetical protein
MRRNSSMARSMAAMRLGVRWKERRWVWGVSGSVGPGPSLSDGSSGCWVASSTWGVRVG